MAEDAGVLTDVLGEEGVVAAGGLRTALQHMPGDDRARELVVVLRPPAEVGGGRPGDEGGVGDPAGDDDVRALAQTGGYAEGAQVGMCGKAVGVAGGEVVALDVGDAGGDAESVGEFPDVLREARRVEATGVDDDPYPPLMGETEALLQLPQEGTGVPRRGVRRVLEAVAAQDEHGQLGEVVAGEDVELAAGEHLAHGFETVAVEAGGVAYAEGRRVALGSRHRVAPFGARPLPGGPAKAWAMSSHWSASGPSARRARSVRWARWVTRRQKSMAGPVTRWGASGGRTSTTRPACSTAPPGPRVRRGIRRRAGCGPVRRTRSPGCVRRSVRHAGAGRWGRVRRRARRRCPGRGPRSPSGGRWPWRRRTWVGRTRGSVFRRGPRAGPPPARPGPHATRRAAARAVVRRPARHPRRRSPRVTRAPSRPRPRRRRRR